MKLGMMRGRVLPMGSAMFGALLTTAALSGCVVRGPGGGGYQQPQSSGGAGSSYNQSSGSNYNQGSSSNYGGATSQPSSQNDAAWVSNAINSINRGLNDPANQQAYAQAILDQTHSTGKNPKLVAGQAARQAGTTDTVVVTLHVDWKGGLLGGTYRTAVRWRFKKDRHLDATVIDDNTPQGVSSSSQDSLDSAFETMYDEFKIQMSQLGY